jgi:chemotaxis protein CheZ
MNASQEYQSLSNHIEELRGSYGETVAIEEVSDVVSSLMKTIEGDISISDLRLHRELLDIVKYIQDARADIASIRPTSLREEGIAVATDELDAVVEATSDATNHILDAAEQIENIADDLDEDTAEKLMKITGGIYEASNFQDITGQRITKVVNVLRTVEQKLESMSHIVDGVAVEFSDAEKKAADLLTIGEDKELLNGPSMPDAANSQDDIDALLASFD